MTYLPAFSHTFGLRPADFWALKLAEFELYKSYWHALHPPAAK